MRLLNLWILRSSLLVPTLLTPALAQQGPFGDGPIRQATTSFEVTLTAGDPQFLQDVLHPNSVIVKETITQDPSEGQLTDTRAGLPNLSVRELDFLLPYDADFRGLDVEVLHEVAQPIGMFEVAPVPVLETYPGADITQSHAWIPEGIQLDDLGRDTAVYGSQLDYPASPVEVASVGQQRAARILRLAFHPFRWNPATRELVRIEQLHLRVSWERRAVRQLTRNDDLGDPQLPSTLAALMELGLHVLEGVDSSYVYELRQTQMDYLIITSQQVIDLSSSLTPFVAMKTAQGFKVGVRSVEWIKANHPAATTQESVRKYLRSIYKQVGLRYLLIISGHEPIDVGDPNSGSEDPIPMYLTWPCGGNELPDDPTLEDQKKHVLHRCPTDLYYGDLSMSGNWDVDGDGFAGERRDDTRTFTYSEPKRRYVTDFRQELVVSRIPFNFSGPADDCLDASIEYQTTSPYEMDGLIGHVRSQVWMAMAETSWSSAHFTGKNDLGDGIASALPPECEPYKMYQVGAWDEELLPDTFVDRWTNQFGPGMAIWAGHGNRIETVMNTDPLATSGWHNEANTGHVIHESDVSGFTTSLSRAFVLSSSCLNANPFAGQESTLLDMLMRNASVGAVMNTGVSFSNAVRQKDWGDHLWNGDMLYDAARLLATGKTLGDSVKHVRLRGDYSGKGGFYGGTKTMNLLGLNAFGDPAIEYLVGWGWLGD